MWCPGVARGQRSSGNNSDRFLQTACDGFVTGATRRTRCYAGQMAIGRVLPYLVVGAAVAVSSASPARGEPGRERRLHVAAAEASSYLVNDWNRFQENYLPLYVGDDDPRTAWNLKTAGIGEWLRLHVTPMQGATKVRLRVRDGFQKSPKLFAANSRLRQVRVVLLPSNKVITVDLADTIGWQEVAVDQPPGPLDGVELHIESVYPGKKYDDACLSDVQVYVTATTPDNPAYEKQHFDKILTWKKERAEAAALFKTALGKTLPVAAQYAVTARRDPDGERPRRDTVSGRCKGAETCWMEAQLGGVVEAGDLGNAAAAVETARAATRDQFAKMTPVRVSVQDRRPVPRVDGICTPTLDSCEADPCEEALSLPLANQTGFLRADGIALIEQSGLPSYADAAAGKPAACHTDAGGTFAWALRDSAVDGGIGQTRALLLLRCGLVEGREGKFTAHHTQLLVYGDNGTLQLTADTGGASLFDWAAGPNGVRLARGRVTRTGFGTSQLTIEAAEAVAAKD